MSAASPARAQPNRVTAGRALTRGTVLSLGIGAAALGRAAINGSSVASALAAGALFALALLALAVGGGSRPQRLRLPWGTGVGWRQRAMGLRGITIGAAGGFVLVAVPYLTHPVLAARFGSAIPFVPWLAVTLLVAAAEEAVLRGALFATVLGLSGPLAAIGITSLTFALIHVPLYGWAVVPLDLAVGVWLAGLRLSSGGVVAPTIAHALADVATWWL